MKFRHYKILVALLFIFFNGLAQYNPQKDLAELFTHVQLASVFPDSKTFVDCVPRFPVKLIKEKYLHERNKKGFELKKFIEENFIVPVSPDYVTSNSFPPIEQHIENLWDRLIRQDKPSPSSL